MKKTAKMIFENVQNDEFKDPWKKNFRMTKVVQKLYKLSVPLKSYEYVVVSASDIPDIPETYIFGSDNQGMVKDWSELPGSFRGEMNHIKALKNAGYEVSE